MESRINKAVKFILNNFDKKINLNELERLSNLSTSHFCHLFKQETGICPSKFIIRTRLDKSCDMLKDPSNSIKKISYEVGYRHVSNFNHDFKNLIGVTPSEYRSILESYFVT